MLPDGATCWGYLLGLPAGATCWGYLLGLPAGATCWGYLLGLPAGATCWGYLLGLPAGATCWGYLLGLPAGPTCWAYQQWPTSRVYFFCLRVDRPSWRVYSVPINQRNRRKHHDYSLQSSGSGSSGGFGCRSGFYRSRSGRRGGSG